MSILHHLTTKIKKKKKKKPSKALSMADHLQYRLNPPLPFPNLPISPSFPSPHYYPPHPFLSAPPLLTCPLLCRNLYYPTPYFLHFYTYPAITYYHALPPMSSPAPVGYGGGANNPVRKQGHCSGITTVMIKNIPNQFKRRDLLQLLDRYCQVMNQQRDSRPHFCVSEYDFVYLPMDFRRSWFQGKVSNLGYAFVNFTTSMAASQFCVVYRNYKWDVNVNKKICEITDARIQGKEALLNAFKNKIFWCRTDQYLPVMLSPASNGHRRYRRVNVGRRIPNVPRKPLRKCVV